MCMGIEWVGESPKLNLDMVLGGIKNFERNFRMKLGGGDKIFWLLFGGGSFFFSFLLNPLRPGMQCY